MLSLIKEANPQFFKFSYENEKHEVMIDETDGEAVMIVTSDMGMAPIYSIHPESFKLILKRYRDDA